MIDKKKLEELQTDRNRGVLPVVKDIKECLDTIGFLFADREEFIDQLAFLATERDRLMVRNQKLEAVSKAAENVYNSIYDPSRNDCQLCDAFLTPCHPTCPTPALDKALAALREDK